ncbi:glycine zipper family protein [bacterium]|nr:glycine zipper family protein [bacterium]
MYNRKKGFAVSILLALTLGGCVTLPSGPSVMSLPGSGKSFDEFQADDFACRQWAGARIGLPPQEAVNQNVASGAVAGTAIGAGLGAAIGAAAGNPGIGAAIGAASGLLVGTSSGLNAGYAYGWEAQRRYDMAYMQCMYASGNQVPSSRQRYQRYQRHAPPPPPAGYNSVPPDYTP